MPHSPARTAFGPPPTERSTEQRTAAAIDAQLEAMASSCNASAVTGQDQRWNKAALALLGARQFFRDLMHDDDRKARR